MSWYKEWFGTDYIDIYTHRNEHEAEEFITTLEKTIDLRAGQNLLDLCCGAGRYSIELAQRGYRVIGQDLSEHLIEHASRAAKLNGCSIEFITKDMRDIPYTAYFDCIVNMFTSFGYFETDQDNERVICSVSNALKGGGWFVLDFMNRPYVLNGFVPFDRQLKGETVIEQHREFHENTNRIVKRIKLIKNGVVKEYMESVRLYSLSELESLFLRNGLAPEYIFGGYCGEPLTEHSPRAIIIGLKK